jgi:lipopolysaccharide/colanic/teichoic acid biosynthesis glycosyltransferase
MTLAHRDPYSPGANPPEERGHCVDEVWEREGAARTRVPAPWEWAAKRTIDIVVSLGLLALALPLLLLAALAIKLTSPGPVLYRWPVVGEGGRPLRAYKLRTMVVDADEMKPRLLARNESTGPVFKMKDDPRVTAVGRCLRKFSLDEAPQLWSVLRGDLSLVGPRPVLVSEWLRFDKWQRRKLAVKPGMICLWHIRGQPRDFDTWVRMDLEYIEHWSLWLDLKILYGAALYVIRGRNC